MPPNPQHNPSGFSPSPRHQDPRCQRQFAFAADDMIISKSPQMLPDCTAFVTTTTTPQAACSLGHLRYQPNHKPYNSLPIRDHCCSRIQPTQLTFEQSNQTDYSDPRATMFGQTATTTTINNNNQPTSCCGEAQTENDVSCAAANNNCCEVRADDVVAVVQEKEVVSEPEMAIVKPKKKRFFTFRLKDSKKPMIEVKRLALPAPPPERTDRGTQTFPVCIVEHHQHQQSSSRLPLAPQHCCLPESAALARYSGANTHNNNHQQQRPTSTHELQLVPRISMHPACSSANDFWANQQSPMIQAAYSPTMSPAPSTLSLDIVSEALVTRFEAIRTAGWIETNQQHHRFRQQPLINNAHYFYSSRNADWPPANTPNNQQQPAPPLARCITADETELKTSALTNDERDKIELFYNSVGSYVYVSTSAAVLFTNQLDAALNLAEWKRLYVGVPIWLFNTGITPKRPRRLQLVMAELGSGFILIDATVDYSSEVRNPRSGYVTLKMKDNKTVIALRFFTISAADAFYKHYRLLYQDKRNIDIFKPHEISGKRSKYRPELYWKKEYLSKKRISRPTSFKHLSSLHDKQRENLYSLTALT